MRCPLKWVSLRVASGQRISERLLISVRNLQNVRTHENPARCDCNVDFIAARFVKCAVNAWLAAVQLLRFIYHAEMNGNVNFGYSLNI